MDESKEEKAREFTERMSAILAALYALSNAVREYEGIPGFDFKIHLKNREGAIIPDVKVKRWTTEELAMPDIDFIIKQIRDNPTDISNELKRIKENKYGKEEK